MHQSCHNDNQAFPEYVAHFFEPQTSFRIRSAKCWQIKGQAGTDRFDLSVRQGWQEYQKQGGQGILSMGLWQGTGNHAWGDWFMDQNDQGAVRLLYRASKGVLCLAVRSNWKSLTDGGKASKFDCLELCNASEARGQKDRCYWMLEQPDGQVLDGVPASVEGGVPFLRIRSVAAGHYLHVRQSWQKLAGTQNDRGKCLMLTSNPNHVGNGFFFDSTKENGF